MQWRILAAAALIIAVFASGWYLGGIRERGVSAAKERDQLAQQVDEILAEQAQDRKRAERLQKTLDKLPRSQGKIREVVTQNPSGCVLSPAVVDSLREAIGKANASREMSANP
jgi:ABC-type sugar transport system substrate-binding protein